MEPKTKTLNSFILRVAAIIIHAILNFIAISYMVNFDITGSWIKFVAFTLAVFGMFYLFLLHIVSFINFLKKK